MSGRGYVSVEDGGDRKGRKKTKKRIAGSKKDRGEPESGDEAPPPAARNGSPRSQGESSDGSYPDDAVGSAPPGLATASYYQQPVVVPLPSAGGGAGIRDAAWVPPPHVTRKLHLLHMAFLFTTVACLLSILTSRSLGMGNAEGVTVGFWSMCAEPSGESRVECGDGMAVANTQLGPAARCWDAAFGRAQASGVVCLLALLGVLALLAVEAAHFRSEDTLVPRFLLWAAAAAWVIWGLLLTSWALFAAFRSDYNACTDADAHPPQVPGFYDLWYAWGFVFLVAIWILQSFFAGVLSMKACGFTAPCEL